MNITDNVTTKDQRVIVHGHGDGDSNESGPTMDGASILSMIADLKRYVRAVNNILGKKRRRGTGPKKFDYVKWLTMCYAKIQKYVQDGDKLLHILSDDKELKLSLTSVISDIIKVCVTLVSRCYYNSLTLFVPFNDIQHTKKRDGITFGRITAGNVDAKKMYSPFQSIWYAWSICVTVQELLSEIEIGLETVTGAKLAEAYAPRGFKLPVYEKSGSPIPICQYNLAEIEHVVNLMRDRYTLSTPTRDIYECIKCLRIRCMVLSCKMCTSDVCNVDKYVKKVKLGQDDTNNDDNAPKRGRVTGIGHDSMNVSQDGINVSENVSINEPEGKCKYAVNVKFIYEICSMLVWCEREYCNYTRNFVRHSEKNISSYSDMMMKNGVKESYVNLQTMSDYLASMAKKYSGEDLTVQCTNACYERYCDFMDTFIYTLNSGSYDTTTSMYTVLNMTKHTLVSERNSIITRCCADARCIVGGELEWNVYVLTLFDKIVKSHCDYDVIAKCHRHVRGMSIHQ